MNSSRVAFQFESHSQYSINFEWVGPKFFVNLRALHHIPGENIPIFDNMIYVKMDF
jgi:hypothetical protein